LIFRGLIISQRAFKTEKSRNFSVLIHPPSGRSSEDEPLLKNHVLATARLSTPDQLRGFENQPDVQSSLHRLTGKIKVHLIY
jgi:hypothetical protein